MSLTPGPWFMGPVNADGWRRVGPTEQPHMTEPAIAFVFGVDSANAHLIAAAPELLAALYHMRSCGECAEDDWQVCEGGRAALAAIAKATGEQP